MFRLTRYRPVRALLLVLWTSTAAACTTWKHTTLSPVPATGFVPSQTVRVTRRDGAQLTLRDAQLRGDTLHGSLVNVRRDMPLGTVAVPMADVADVQARRISVLKVLVGGASMVFMVWGLTMLGPAPGL